MRYYLFCGIKTRMKIRSEPVTFTCGTMSLHGVLHLPGTPDPPVVIGSHGLEGTMNSAKQRLLADLLPGLGIAFLRFDHRGCGQSDGRFENDTSLDLRAADMAAAATHVLALGLTGQRLALFGSSLGGATAIAAWSLLESRGISPLGAVVCAAPLVSRTIKAIPLEGNQNRPALPMEFFERNLLFDLTRSAAGVHHLLIFHGGQDEVVPVENARMIFDLALEPKEMVIHENGGHRMSDPDHQADFARRTAQWFKHCLRP